MASSACGLIGGLTAALEPYLVGVIIDHLSQGASRARLLGDIGLMFLLSFITMAAFWGQRHYSGEVAYGVTFDVRRDLFQQLLRLDYYFYQQNRVGDLIARLYNDIDNIWRLLAITTTRFASAIMTLGVSFVLLATINLPLTGLVFLVLMLSTAFQVQMGRYLHLHFEAAQEQGGNLAALVQDSASGILTIKTFGREAGLADKFAQENAEFRRRYLYFRYRYEPVGMLPNMISQSMVGVVVLAGGYLAAEGQISLGNFVQFLLYLSFISTVLLQLGTIYQRGQQARGAISRLTPLLQEPQIDDAPQAQAFPRPRGEIRFQGVRVEMDGETLLHDLNLHIGAGETLGVVGATAAGKTLLVSLLARVIDPTAGRITIDGQDIKTLKLADLRAALAYVPQNTFLFSDTLEENIRLGQDQASPAQVMQAVQIARLAQDLGKLPEGLQTLVGEKGVMLSGGQKQRAAIARAIVRDPAILILDDALSSVDTRTAAGILADLRHILQARTSIIIAQRMATVKDADQIIVLGRGKIIEQGTHESLMALGGLYAHMVERESNHAQV
jgi:ATP-binding cassette subfamily B protein